jgi:hypothetical protein
MSKKKVVATSEKVDQILSKITEVSLRQICDENKRLNITKFVRSLALSVMRYHRDPLNDSTSRLTGEQKNALNDFLSNIALCVGVFMDFLDYDDDGVVELVKRENGKHVIGDDIQLIVDDMKKIGKPFKNTGETHNALFEALSNLYVYLTSDSFTETKDDVEAFKDAVIATHNSLKLVKNTKIDLKGIVLDKVDDIVFFIIMICMVTVASVESVSRKLVKIADSEKNKNDLKPEDLIFSDQEIRDAVKDKFSVKFDIILDIIQRIIKVFSESINYNSIRKKIKKYLYCC